MPSSPVGPMRKRLRRCEAPGAVRFITFSSHKRLPVLDLESRRDMLRSRLAAAALKHRVHVIAWVIMPEHMHLLLRPTTDVPLWKMLESFKKYASAALLAHMIACRDLLLEHMTRPDGRYRVWQKGGGFDRNVRSVGEMQREIAYIHSNPVKRGLVEHPCDWAWSSARWWVARFKGAAQDAADVPCDWPPGDPRAWAAWRGFLKRPAEVGCS